MVRRKKRVAAIAAIDGRLWRTPATPLLGQASGEAEVRSYPIRVGSFVSMYGVPFAAAPGCTPGSAGVGAGTPLDYAVVTGRKLAVAELRVAGATWMVDDPPHALGMLDHATYYRGRVLVAGLGLGLVLHALAALPAVTDVLVVERSPDVIALVGPHLPRLAGGRAIDFLVGDWNDEATHDAVARAHARAKFDGVFFDLFVGDGPAQFGSALRVMLDLRARFPAALCRIHGFANDHLNSLCAAAEHAQRLFPNLAALTSQESPQNRGS